MSARVVAILGPTAVGKTSLGIRLGRHIPGEVINADSRYLYRGFSIGVAKPSLAEQAGVPHHLIDILEPSEEMSLALYQDRANQAIRSVLTGDQLPLLVGGTPLYANAVIEGWSIPNVPPDPAFRASLQQRVDRGELSALIDELSIFDPESARRAAGNARRVIRALEIFTHTGKTMTELQGKGPPPFDTLQLGLWMPRNRLFEAIDRRVDKQIASGLVDEVRSLLLSGVDPNCPAFSAIGYRQLLPYLANEIRLSDAVDRIKYDTHRYVRHQETWLKKNRSLIQIDVTDSNWQDRCIGLVETFLTGKGE